jgi:DNA-directed RNA polymerase subunit F
MNLVASYAFENDQVFAIHEGRVVAAGTDLNEVESEATAYLQSIASLQQDEARKVAKEQATHIVTAGNLKGKILNRVPSTWGEEVTAQFGDRVASFNITDQDNVEWVTENQKTASSNPLSKLAARVEADFDQDKPSLTARHDELLDVSREAQALLSSGASYAQECTLDELRTAALAEAQIVKQAIDHLDATETEAFAPPSFIPQAAEQASMGRSDSWLDATVQDMIDESEGQDFDKLMNEGPSVFTTGLETGALADAGTTLEMASSYVFGKTAGYEGEEVENYRQQWVARVETARRKELSSRTKNVAKKASVEEEKLNDVPDSALFG